MGKKSRQYNASYQCRTKTYGFLIQTDLHLEHVDQEVDLLFLTPVLEGGLSGVDVVDELLDGAGAHAGARKEEWATGLKRKKKRMN